MTTTHNVSAWMKGSGLFLQNALSSLTCTIQWRSFAIYECTSIYCICIATMGQHCDAKDMLVENGECAQQHTSWMQVHLGIHRSIYVCKVIGLKLLENDERVKPSFELNAAREKKKCNAETKRKRKKRALRRQYSAHSNSRIHF